MRTDERLAQAARAMISAEANGIEPMRELRQLLPGIYRQLQRISVERELLGLWGESLNFDENAQKLIVEPVILESLCQFVDVPLRGRIVHAGLEHTYGYLFSLIETPFGYKRTRWTSSLLDKKFGFNEATLRAQPRSGTLLGNLTWFLGNIAFRNRRSELMILESHQRTVAKKLRQFGFANLLVRRITESVAIAKTSGLKVHLHTDLVSFPGAASMTDSSGLLVYSILDDRLGRGQLITAFPVNEEIANGVIASALEDSTPIRPRYNAFVEGLMNRQLDGSRTLGPVQNCERNT